MRIVKSYSSDKSTIEFGKHPAEIYQIDDVPPHIYKFTAT